MKNSNILLFIIWLLMLQVGLAQLYEVPLAQCINQSEYIFEGKVLESHSFYGPNQRMIYTSHLVQVYSVFKGQFPNNQVEIITVGGQVGDAAVELTHSLELRPSQHGLFFSNTTNNLPNDRQVNGGLYLKVYAGLQGFIQFHFDGVNPKASAVFQIYDIPDQLYSLIEAQTGQLRQNWTSTLREANDFYLQYVFSYPQLSSSGGNTYLDFEIQGEVSGGSYEFGDANIFIEYDTTLLGSGLAGAGKLIIYQGDITSSADYSFSLIDYAPNILKFSIDAINSPVNLGNVDVWADDVLRVQVDVTGISPGIEALFNQPLMNGESYYYDGASNTYLQFPFVWAIDTINYVSSGPVRVDSVYPRLLTAGTFDTLYVKGEGFGSVPGKFLFPDANKGVLTRTHALLEDIVWTDSLLKIHVFSNNDTNAVAGSGFVSLITNQGDTLKDFKAVFISYAVDNRRDNNNLSYLATLVDFVGGDSTFTFELSDKVKITSDTAVVARKTLLQWQCATGIKWELAGSTTATDTLEADGVNLVLFTDSNQNFMEPGVLAFTSKFSTDCITANGIRYHYVYEIDLAINKQIAWDVATSLNAPIDTGKHDLWSVMLHEFGHAHLLMHALEVGSSKVMYPFHKKGTALRTLQPDDIAGGLWIMDYG